MTTTKPVTKAAVLAAARKRFPNYARCGLSLCKHERWEIRAWSTSIGPHATVVVLAEAPTLAGVMEKIGEGA